MNARTHELYKRSMKMPEWYNDDPIIDTGTLSKTYIGIVKDSRDPQRMGRLMAWIPDLSGDANRIENWTMCSYCSPFAGASFFNIGIHEDKAVDVDTIKSLKESTRLSGRIPDFELDENKVSGRQSYGMWFVPPDIGNEVLITFINGDPNRAVWFGCMFQQDSNHMVPGIAQNKIFNDDQIREDEEGPVIEHDSREGFNQDSPNRKVYSPLRDGLKKFQGLDRDEVRGQSSSSATREAPSEVFGILTPNGNSFVMDDVVDQELIRMRTKSGAQLLISQTTGIIYMISRDGKTWLELSNEGNVDIYGDANVSVHAEKANVNIKAGLDINMQATRDMNLRVGGNFTMLVEGDADTKVLGSSVTEIGGFQDIGVTGKISINSGGTYNVSASSNLAMSSGAQIGLTASSDIREQGANIHMNGPTPVSPIGPQTAIEPQNFERPQPPKEPTTETPCFIKGDPYPEGVNIIPRVPQHEPWEDHQINTKGTNRQIPEGPLSDALPGATSSTAEKPNNFTLPDGTRTEGVGFTAAGIPECIETGTVPADNLKPTAQRQISQNGIDLIKQFEGSENNVYKDVAGLDTIGVGHLITAEEKAAGTFDSGFATDEQIDALLLQDLDSIQRSIRGCIKQPVSQNQYDALVSMAFNIGPSAFCSSTLVKKINTADYKEVPNQMLRWTKARVSGVLTPVQGLVNRRVAEANLFAQA